MSAIIFGIIIAYPIIGIPIMLFMFFSGMAAILKSDSMTLGTGGGMLVILSVCGTCCYIGSVFGTEAMEASFDFMFDYGFYIIIGIIALSPFMPLIIRGLVGFHRYMDK